MALETPPRSLAFFAPPPAGREPRVVVLEASFCPEEGQPPEVRRHLDPTWGLLEQCIRELDQGRHPSIRLSVTEEGRTVILDILGGCGKYVLRQPDGGWVYYDPSHGEEEVEVHTGVGRSSYPAFFVCTDLDRVLTTARHFVETGGFE